MKSRTVCHLLILVVLVAAVIPASSIPTRPGPYVDDPPPEPGGFGEPNTPGGLCTYCAALLAGTIE